MRKYWIDYLKCLAAFGVVCIHVTGPFYHEFGDIDAPSWWVSNIINAFARFPVPIFIMVSGALLLGRSMTVGEFYKKRFVRLFWPLLFWSGFYFAFKVYTGGNVKDILISAAISGDMFYHLWYLPMFMCVMAFAPFINNFMLGNKPVKSDMLILGGVFGAFFTLTWIAHLLKVTENIKYDWFNAFPLYLCYFVFGYYISQNDAILKKVRNSIIIGGIVILSAIGAVLNYASCEWLGVIQDCFALHNLGLLSATITFLIFILFCRNKDSLKENRLILAVSDASFGIYLVHPFFLNAVRCSLPNYLKNGICYIPLTIFLVMLLSFVSIHLVRKTRLGQMIC